MRTAAWPDLMNKWLKAPNVVFVGSSRFSAVNPASKCGRLGDHTMPLAWKILTVKHYEISMAYPASSGCRGGASGA
jgi:hypothetical protein